MVANVSNSKDFHFRYVAVPSAATSILKPKVLRVISSLVLSQVSVCSVSVIYHHLNKMKQAKMATTPMLIFFWVFTYLPISTTEQKSRTYMRSQYTKEEASSWQIERARPTEIRTISQQFTIKSLNLFHFVGAMQTSLLTGSFSAFLKNEVPKPKANSFNNLFLGVYQVFA